MYVRYHIALARTYYVRVTRAYSLGLINYNLGLINYNLRYFFSKNQYQPNRPICIQYNTTCLLSYVVLDNEKGRENTRITHLLTDRVS